MKLQSSRGEAQEPIQRPPRVFLEEIAAKVDRGDFAGLERTIDNLMVDNADYVRFCDQIRRYVRGYDDEAITRFLALEAGNG
jgi:hypothetical protein